MNIKLNKKSAEIAVLIFCEVNDNALSFSLVLSEAHLPCETPNMECFSKIVNGRIQLYLQKAPS